MSIFSSRIEFVPTETVNAEQRTHWQQHVLVGRVASAPGLFKYNIRAVQAQVPPHQNHAGVWQSTATMTAQEWRLRTKLEAKGLVLLQPVFLLPTISSSSAKEDTVLPSAQIQRYSFLPPH